MDAPMNNALTVFHKPSLRVRLVPCALLLALTMVAPIRATLSNAAVSAADTTQHTDLRRTLSRTISVDLRNVTLDSALKEISHRAGVPLNYSHSRIPLAQVVSVKKDSATAYDVLEFLLAYTKADLTLAGNGRVAVVPRTYPLTRNDGTIHGIVLDSATEKPIAGATALLIDRYSTTTSDTSGRFRFPRVSPGTYTLTISHIGYNSRTFPNLSPNEDSSSSLRVLLSARTLLLPSITVSPGTFAIMETGASASQSLTREDIQTVAQFGEDVYRTVTRIPGVTSDDYSARFSVRGGRYENVLVLLDGQEIHEPFHVKDVNGGVVSIIDAEAVEGITLRTGGFPAEFGNRTSGVFDVTTRRPREPRRNMSIGLSLTNFRVTTDGTFSGNKGSWLFVARRGYLDLVLDLMKEIESPRPAYYDVLSRVSYRLTPNQELSFHVLHAHDKMTLYATDPDGDIDQTASRYGNSYVWLSLSSTYSPRLRSRTNISLARVTRDRFGETYNVPLDRLFFRVTDKNTYDEFGIKQDWTANLSDRIQLKWGADLKPAATKYTSKSEIVDSTVDGSGAPVLDTVTYAAHVDRNGQSLGVYMSSRLRLSQRVTVELGGRYDGATHTGDADLSPRVGAVYQAGPSTFVRAGWGFYRQMQAMQRLDVLDGVTSFYPSELARHWTIGIEHRLASGIDLRVEAYDIRSANPNPSFRNWKNDLYQFHNAVEDDRIAVYPSAFARRGFEVLARRSNGGRFGWMGSYALAFNNETLDSATSHFYEIPFDRKIGAPLDQRHSLLFGGTYRCSENWTLHLSWSFHTGWPFTRARIDTIATDAGNAYYLRPGRLNGDRLPAYSSLNTRITRHIKFRGGQLRMFLDVLNLLGQSNVYSVDGEILDAPAAPRLVFEDRTWLRWLPSIGITWTKEF